MQFAKELSSPQNPAIKRLLGLKDKSRDRKKTGLFVVEGQRELRLALEGGYAIEEVFFCKDIISGDALTELLGNPTKSPRLNIIPKALYAKIAHRGSTEGILAILKTKDHHLSTLKINRKNPLILVAEAPEKPGNLGALLRTADAAAVDAVLVADLKGDLYNPNTIRSSVGCIFTVPVGLGTASEILEFLNHQEIKTFAAVLGAEKKYHEADYTGGTAIAVGTEAVGLTPIWTKEAAATIEIPMQGRIDSMNVSVAAAILIFEAKRQRDFKG